MASMTNLTPEPHSQSQTHPQSQTGMMIHYDNVANAETDTGFPSPVSEEITIPLESQPPSFVNSDHTELLGSWTSNYLQPISDANQKPAGHVAISGSQHTERVSADQLPDSNVRLTYEIGSNGKPTFSISKVAPGGEEPVLAATNSIFPSLATLKSENTKSGFLVGSVKSNTNSASSSQQLDKEEQNVKFESKSFFGNNSTLPNFTKLGVSDTYSSEEVIMNSKLGCGGKVRVLEAARDKSFALPVPQIDVNKPLSSFCYGEQSNESSPPTNQQYQPLNGLNFELDLGQNLEICEDQLFSSDDNLPLSESGQETSLPRWEQRMNMQPSLDDGNLTFDHTAANSLSAALSDASAIILNTDTNTRCPNVQYTNPHECITTTSNPCLRVQIEPNQQVDIADLFAQRNELEEISDPDVFLLGQV